MAILGEKEALGKHPLFGAATFFLEHAAPLGEFKRLSFGLIDQTENSSNALIFNILELLTWHFFDRRVFENPPDLTAESEALLRSVFEKMEAKNRSLESLRDGWRGDELKQKLNAKTVDEILRLMK